MFEPKGGTIGVNGVEKVKDSSTHMTPISETVMKNSLRNQKLMELRQIVSEVVGKETWINGGQMNTLLGHRRFVQVFFGLFNEGKGDALCQEKWLDQIKHWTGVSMYDAPTHECINSLSIMISWCVHSSHCQHRS